jgi:uncharacterized protein (DUF983 family)
MADAPFRNPSSIECGIRQCCPRCGEGRLFKGFLAIAPSCERCGLDYGFADPADGPAFFVMTGVGIAVIAAWTIWVIAAQPPMWAQFAAVFPALIVGCLGTLRPVKAWLVAEQYLHKAEEARWISLGAHGSGGFGPRGRAVD